MDWVSVFICLQGRSWIMLHPDKTGASKVEAFRTMLAAKRHVAAFTPTQALSALLWATAMADLPSLAQPGHLVQGWRWREVAPTTSGR
jgi:hypothetical protein